MSVINISSFLAGKWVGPEGDLHSIHSAVTGKKIALLGSQPPQAADIIEFAKSNGGQALRDMTFHERAKALKKLALFLNDRREELYQLSQHAGSTLSDAKIDVDGGIGTLLVFASKGRRELPDAKVLLDGELEMLSREGSFVGQHIFTPKQGVAVHINAFNFPVWGMLEKLGPTLLAGMPAIVKPASVTSYIAEACFKLMLKSEAFPEGSFQLVSGSLGDVLDNLGPQDVVSFTGSASTALMLRSNKNILEKSIPFIAEQDSLNATVLGPDATEGTPEFDTLVKEVCAEMTAKAGQKCTAIRRILIPSEMLSAVSDAITAKLAEMKIGDPALPETQMGALVSHSHREDVQSQLRRLSKETISLYGGELKSEGSDLDAGAFMKPQLLCCENPDDATNVHSTEAFGPVSTIMPYRDIDHAGELLNRGGGSLVFSLISHDTNVAQRLVAKSATWHGRIYINNRDSAKESTGHGSPLPHMTHGGPGRAGGGEELGGIRGVKHYMARTAVQGSPDMISAVGETWVPGSAQQLLKAHPFTRRFGELSLGETLITGSRTITLEDIEKFAHFTGDTFYAHMDEEAAAENPFFPGRVAHGYLLLSFAAGLFVQPDPGPVLANTGLTNLSFQKPVSPGDSIKVVLTVKRKTGRTDSYGEVRWHVRLLNQDEENVAEYELHTMNAY